MRKPLSLNNFFIDLDLISRYHVVMVTKMEISRALGLSHTCVGAVLNDSPYVRVSQQTRRRILAQARLMGYESRQPPLQTVQKTTICYVLCDRSIESPDASYLGILKALHVEAIKDKRQVIFMSTSSDPPALAECLHAIDDHEPLGVVLDGFVTEAAVTAIAERKLPFVVSGATRYAHNPELTGSVNAVGVDVTGGISQLMQWFYQQGARRVALSMSTPDLTYSSLILNAYRQAAQQTEPGYDPALVQISNESSGKDVTLAQRLGYLGVDYDAMLFSSIDRAIRALSFPSPAPELANLPPLVGAFGSPGLAGQLPENMRIYGPSLSDIGREIYSILAAEVSYAVAKKRVSIVPCVLRGARLL